MIGLDWDTVVAHALSLPGAELSTYYGGPAVKANGNAFLTPGREADSFHLMLDLDTVDMLMETDPDTFWQTPHYVGWPGLLVRYVSADPERVLAMIERAHERALAKKPPRPRKK
ncbi:MmcQ/YjbR family DNA-binding protein [Sphingomonas montanisoli]|uniref:MmcQ/YjbR family DNA-binding protein n=1 Tax=Sphingomonas montanisoli TaxID=2606412 RepID=UPI001FE32464|nr:MmcQ/YjbR family DNA-binding protein [Sphingomonas montanisoli]